ncbi:MAG: HNH endonuclease [Elusimicrobiales bacterium]|nr:HNH endonuclease [Elusimicrobiales bacterium]
MKNLYSEYMKEQNLEGSNKASSYIRALDLLGPIVKKNIWAVKTPQQIEELYKEVLIQQNLGEKGVFRGQEPSSYWKSRFYSAALKSYQEFLVLAGYESELWGVYNAPGISASELSRKLSDKEINGAKLILPGDGQKGEDALRQVKTRINQGFFRKMILNNYDTQCCITGLNIPDVLRASHIVAWAEDEENRLNPANGLCLSATYDTAFDRFLITFDENYRMLLHPRLEKYYSNRAFQDVFKSYEGRQLTMPKRFVPSQKFLDIHRKMTFK